MKPSPTKKSPPAKTPLAKKQAKKHQSSKQWMREHVNDPFVQMAQKEGYRSRAAYKLLEIDAKDHLLEPGTVVVDLGATPGGWSQVAATKVGRSGTVIALDLLPLDALKFSPQAKYIYIGRDGRDTVWSFHNHHYNATDEYFRVYNEGRPAGLPLLERGTPDPAEFYRAWMEHNGYPIWPFWVHIRSWWAARHLPNVMLVHFNDLKADLDGSIRRIAAFLEIPVDEANWPDIVNHCSFDYMKGHASEVAPRGGIMWQGGAATFINKGTNGRWRDALSPEEIAAYEAKALAELGPDCARWLAKGGGV